MMIVQSLILGLVQGLTEFLPVSSSGHLIVMRNLLGVSSPPLIYDLILHLATTIAAIIFFWKNLIRLKLRQIFIIVMANIPVGIVGVLFNDQIELWFSSLALVSLALVLTGVFNIFSDKLLQKQLANQKLDQEGSQKFPNLKQGLVVGFFQMLALTPGLSRSGSTVFAGLLSGLNREAAFTFSFLLVIPAILGATLLEATDVAWTAELSSLLPVYFLGAVVAFVVGLFSLWLLKKLLVSSKWEIFGIYCLSLGLVLILGQVLGFI